MTAFGLAIAFLAGFISVLIFHQGVWAIFGAAGKAPSPAWNMTPTKPLGIPQVISSAFWGGVWGIVMALIWPFFSPFMSYWPFMIVIGGLLTTLVSLFAVAPAKGRPFAAGWDPAIWIMVTAVNAAWGLGLGILLLAIARMT